MQSSNAANHHFSPISHASQFQQKLRARILANSQPVHILIANAKGGCGKIRLRQIWPVILPLTKKVLR